MKILFNHHMPFSLAHGGGQIQIEQTQRGLESVGVTVESLRWWDDRQTGDILHHFGRVPYNILQLAHAKGMKVVFSDLMTATGSRSPERLRMQRYAERILRRALPRPTIWALSWDSYIEADACIALTRWEGHLMTYLFRAPPSRVHVVPNGVEDAFLHSKPRQRGKWLVCTATITPRKRVLEAAQAAASAGTPLWIIGNPYSETDPYYKEFADFSKRNSEVIRYEGPISDRARLAEIYREARGFVLLSTMESLSLSALEAAACECPLLLSEQPWASMTFVDKAVYCPVDASLASRAGAMREFYDKADKLPRAPIPLSWPQVGEQIKRIYEAVLRT